MNGNDITDKVLKSKGLRKALHEHEGFTTSAFAGVSKGISYALLFTIMYGNFVTWGIWAAVSAVPAVMFFYLMTRYDALLVYYHNLRETEKVIASYTVANMEEFLDLPQDTDSTGDLDGTKGAG